MPAGCRMTWGPRQGQRTLGGGPAGLEPPLQGGLALAGGAAGENALDADVLVQVGPVDAGAPADQPPVGALGRGPVSEARVPRQRRRDRPTITQLELHRLVG